MNPEKVYRFSGYLSLVFGVLAACSIYKMSLLFYGIPVAMAGFVLSGINIFLGSKHGLDEGKFSKGYLGMFLSSLPVIFLLVLNLKFRSS